jgi:hypothetical protein
MAPQESQGSASDLDKAEAKAKQALFATFSAITAQQGLTGQLGDSPNPAHWERIMGQSARSTSNAAGMTPLTSASQQQPVTTTQSSATKPSGQTGHNVTGSTTQKPHGPK